MGTAIGRSVRWRVYMHGLPAMAWAVFLMVTALSPSLGPIEDIDIVTHQDKIVHFLQYFILSFLTFFALVRGTKRDRGWQLRTTVVAVIVYGVILEVLQLAVPERDPSVLDVLANVTGAILGAYVAQAVLEPVALRKD
ncbi:MAG: VanZ family protein [Thermoplasmata archaeon]|nr:MAG: VanZ family protein [Thermoplasmata archaeon]